MSNRAKIFSPFAALRGYEDEIASEGRDHLKGNRIELSEEGKQALNQKISQLRKGQKVTIKYFTDGYYEDIAGVLDAVDVINAFCRVQRTPMRFRADAVQSTTDALKQCIFSYSRGFITTV